MLEGVEGGHDSGPLTRRGRYLFAEGHKILTQTVHLWDGQRYAASVVRHFPDGERGEDEVRNTNGRYQLYTERLNFIEKGSYTVPQRDNTC